MTNPASEVVNPKEPIIGPSKVSTASAVPIPPRIANHSDESFSDKVRQAEDFADKAAASQGDGGGGTAEMRSVMSAVIARLKAEDAENVRWTGLTNARTQDVRGAVE